MKEPLVCCVMLTTRDRPEMAIRAFNSFDRQTYPNKRLLIAHNLKHFVLSSPPDKREVIAVVSQPHPDAGIFELMNDANVAAVRWGCDLIAKWDDDDWSHPNRLSEQVALMQQTDAMVVGYNTLPILDTTPTYGIVGDPSATRLQAPVYLYSNPSRKYAVGTSLMYRREAWEQFHFPDTKTPRGTGSDTAFGYHWAAEDRLHSVPGVVDGEPRMIATLHGGNTALRIKSGMKPADPALADRVRTIMEVA